MDSPKALAKKIRKRLGTHPESAEKLLASLGRLIKFLGLTPEETRNLKLLAGFACDGFAHLSITKDERLYDVLDTYELGKRFAMVGSLESAWDSIRSELETTDPIYGSATHSTIADLKQAFSEIKKAVGTPTVPTDLVFESFVRNKAGELIFLL